MTPRAMKFVPYFRVEDHLREGWMISTPNAAMHHHHYGLELKWICECRIPGAKFDRVTNRVPVNQSETKRDDQPTQSIR